MRHGRSATDKDHSPSSSAVPALPTAVTTPTTSDICSPAANARAANSANRHSVILQKIRA
jgi:hypothetical protein